MTIRLLLASCTLTLCAYGQIHVDASNTPPGSGTLADPYTSLQDGVDNVPSGGTVLVFPGTYGAIFVPAKEMTIESVAGPHVTIIDGNSNAPWCVKVDGGEPLTLRGLTMTNGATFGMHSLYTQTTHVIDDCAFVNNGWMGLFSNTPTTATDCTFSGGNHGFSVNSGTFVRCDISGHVDDGAEVRGGNGTLTLTDCSVTNNGGSGVRHEFWQSANCTLTVERCRITGNGNSGVHAESQCVTTISECIVTNNSSPIHGGGIYAANAPIAVSNTLVADNSCVQKGGGLYIRALSLMQATIRGCTVTGNTSDPAQGAGVHLRGIDLASGIANSIVWGNAGGPDVFLEGSPVFVGLYSNVGTGFSGPTILSADPRFLAPAAGDYRLDHDSPCRDAGSNAESVGASDFEGDPRIGEGAVDMGADEFCLPSTGDDFDIASLVDDDGDPDLCVKTASPGQALAVTYLSPGGALDLVPAALGIQAFPAGAPPVLAPVLPGIWLDPATAFITDAVIALPPGGVSRSAA